VRPQLLYIGSEKDRVDEEEDVLTRDTAPLDLCAMHAASYPNNQAGLIFSGRLRLIPTPGWIHIYTVLMYSWILIVDVDFLQCLIISLIQNINSG
jgi:hypothetical protein